MKKVVWGKALLVVLFFFSSVLLATGETQQEEVSEKTKAEILRQEKIEARKRAEEEAARAAQEAKKLELVKKIKPQLLQQGWIIYLVPSGPNPTKSEIKKDTLTFNDISVTSQYFSDKGFRNSNYALNANEDGTGIWETMQRTPNGDIAFWRGEFKDAAMRGALGLQPKKGQAQEFAFTTEKPAGYVEPLPKKEEKEGKGEPAKKEVNQEKPKI